MNNICEGDASNLQFGPEFRKQKEINTLSISVVGFLLQHKQSGIEPSQLGAYVNHVNGCQ